MSLTPQVLSALEGACNPNPEIRLAADAQLQQLKEGNPGPYFMACIELLTSPTCPLIGRELAGFQLKNNLFYLICSGNNAVVEAIINGAMQFGIVDAERKVRKVSSSIISLAIQGKDKVSGLPAGPVVQHLCTTLAQGANIAAVDGAIMTISKLVDDCIVMFDAQQMTATILQAVLPYLTSNAFGNSKEAIDIRVNALDTVAIILEQAGMDFECFTFKSTQSAVIPVIQACFQNLQNPLSNTIAAKCITCIVYSMVHESQITDSYFQTILQLMIQATTQEQAVEEELRIAAVQFWSAVLNFPRLAQLSAVQIQHIIPTLIKCMVYSDMEIGMLSGSQNDWQQEDKEDEIRPKHFQSKVQSTQEEEDDDDDDEVEEWNLRRVSARTLDDISTHFGEPILDPTLSIIKELIDPNYAWKNPSVDWKYLEAALLALGAITEGCLQSMKPYLDAFSGHLLTHLQNQNTHFLVVCIALWDCEQIVEHMVNSPQIRDGLITAVLSRMQSPSKKVQESATSALLTIVEECEVDQLEPYVPLIVKTCTECLEGFQLKNRLLLLETLGPLCGKISGILQENPSAVEQLLAPLSKIWASTADTSIFLFSVFECMSNVCAAVGPVLPPDIVTVIFQRAVRQLQLNMGALQTNDDAPEFVVTAADLLSGLLDGLGSSIEPHVAPIREDFLNIIMAMIHCEHPNVRQSGFCLCGDINKAFPAYIQSILPLYCEGLRLNFAAVTEDTYRVVSNAAWSVCNLLENEVMINDLPTLSGSKFCNQIYQDLAKLFVESEITVEMRNMADNVALALGMMLYTDPEVANRTGCPAAYFSKRFCEFMRRMKQELPQKTLALNGYISAMESLPSGATNHLYLVVELACSMYSEPVDTIAAMTRLLAALAQADPAAWGKTLQQLRPQQRRTLLEAYGVQ